MAYLIITLLLQNYKRVTSVHKAYRGVPLFQKWHMMHFLIPVLAFTVANIFYGSCNHLTTASNSTVNIQQAIGGLFDGCYSDAHKSLTTRGNYRQRFSQNSNSMCVKVCKDKGFAVAATKGADCFCSNSLPVPLLHGSRDRKAAGNGGPCSTVCPGAFVFGNCRGDECCGGKNAYSVYIVDSIDILKELINRIATNFKNNPTRMHNSILTPAEKSLLNCQCFNGEVSIYLTAKSLNKDGRSAVRTVKSIIDIGNHHTVEETKAVSGLQETQLVLKSVEKLLESDEPIIEAPFAQWDLLCDNYFGGDNLVCQKQFSESAGFSETHSTEHGVSVGVKFGLEITNDFLFAKSKKTFELSLGYSFTAGYSKTTENTKTEGFTIRLTVQKGTKAEVRFFKSDQPVRVKWRANFFADGGVLIDYGGVGIKKTIHLSRLLSYDQRKLFALGTVDYGERPTIIARTRTVDRQGNIISERTEDQTSI